jgi:hypothetical protein
MATLLDELRKLSAVDCDTLDAEGQQLAHSLPWYALRLLTCDSGCEAWPLC